jgi:hypothetical protein
MESGNRLTAVRLSVCLTTGLFQLGLDISAVSTAFYYVGSCHDFAWRFNA